VIVEEVVEAMDEVAVAADGHAIAAHAALVSSTYGAASMFTNKPLVTAFVSFVVAQFLKVFTTWYVALLAAARFVGSLPSGQRLGTL
jgi:hypothetical protein